MNGDQIYGQLYNQTSDEIRQFSHSTMSTTQPVIDPTLFGDTLAYRISSMDRQIHYKLRKELSEQVSSQLQLRDRLGMLLSDPLSRQMSDHLEVELDKVIEASPK